MFARTLRFSARAVSRPQVAYVPSANLLRQSVAFAAPRHYTSRSPILYQEPTKEQESQEADIEEPQQDVADAQPEPHHKDILISQLEKQLEEFTNNWKAAQAEAENVRKIMTRDVSRAKEAGIDKLAKKLFPMSDTLDICLQNKPDFTAAPHKDNGHAQRAFEGIQAAKSQLVSILKGMDIEEVVPKLGDQVDPPADKSLPPGTIGMVLKVGWKRDTLLLRPASVGVVRRY